MAKGGFGRRDTRYVKVNFRLDDGEVVVVGSLGECDWCQGLDWEYGGGIGVGHVRNLVF